MPLPLVVAAAGSSLRGTGSGAASPVFSRTQYLYDDAFSAGAPAAGAVAVSSISLAPNISSLHLRRTGGSVAAADLPARRARPVANGRRTRKDTPILTRSPLSRRLASAFLSAGSATASGVRAWVPDASETFLAWRLDAHSHCCQGHWPTCGPKKSGHAFDVWSPFRLV